MREHGLQHIDVKLVKILSDIFFSPFKPLLSENGSQNSIKMNYCILRFPIGESFGTDFLLLRNQRGRQIRKTEYKVSSDHKALDNQLPILALRNSWSVEDPELGHGGCLEMFLKNFPLEGGGLNSFFPQKISRYEGGMNWKFLKLLWSVKIPSSGLTIFWQFVGFPKKQYGMDSF